MMLFVRNYRARSGTSTASCRNCAPRAISPSQIQWQDEPVQFRFRIRKGRMTVSQNGVALGSARWDFPPPPVARTQLGDGIFGKCPVRVASKDP